jgi:hypothetical protein
MAALDIDTEVPADENRHYSASHLDQIAPTSLDEILAPDTPQTRPSRYLVERDSRGDLGS